MVIYSGIDLNLLPHSLAEINTIRSKPDSSLWATVAPISPFIPKENDTLQSTGPGLVVRKCAKSEHQCKEMKQQLCAGSCGKFDLQILALIGI
jgi:hypothetical protein